MTAVLAPAVIDQATTVITTLAARQRRGVAIVGIFDSGIGGLSVLPPLTKPVQLFSIFYRGDTAHFPYGEKSESELIPLVLADCAYLVDCGCSIIGIACNTASIVWRKIVSQLPLSVRELAARVVIDTISTTMATLTNHRPHKTIGIIGTSFTVQSGAYERAILAEFPDSKPIILQSAEQKLINAIERGEQIAINQELARIMTHFSKFNLDIFILGCTHYGHIAPKIIASLPKKVRVLDPSVLLGKQLQKSLVNIETSLQQLNQPDLSISFTGEV